MYAKKIPVTILFGNNKYCYRILYGNTKCFIRSCVKVNMTSRHEPAAAGSSQLNNDDGYGSSVLSVRRWSK